METSSDPFWEMNFGSYLKGDTSGVLHLVNLFIYFFT